jgi:hypothetical protein
MPTNTPTTATALTCLHQAHNDLLRAILPAAEAADSAISHAERLATVVEGDLRAGAR